MGLCSLLKLDKRCMIDMDAVPATAAALAAATIAESTAVPAPTHQRKATYSARLSMSALPLPTGVQLPKRASSNLRTSVLIEPEPMPSLSRSASVDLTGVKIIEDSDDEVIIKPRHIPATASKPPVAATLFSPTKSGPVTRGYDDAMQRLQEQGLFDSMFSLILTIVDFGATQQNV